MDSFAEELHLGAPLTLEGSHVVEPSQVGAERRARSHGGGCAAMIMAFSGKFLVVKFS